MIKQDSFILIWMENVNIQNKILNKGNLAVGNLNLRINAGEFVCISGLHGTDKISLINTLSCLDVADAGKYLYDYNDTTIIERSKLDRLRSQIGFIFKNLNIIEDFTVYQNIEIPISISGIDKKSNNIVKAAEELGLIDLLHTKVKTLTDIERYKVALARAIVVNPILIIADEPGDGLKLEDAEFVLKILSDINAQGTAVICFSEKKQIIEKVQRHIVFEKGSIISDNGSMLGCIEEGAV